MKTAHTQAKLLFRRLKDSDLKAAVAGRVYLYKQPTLTGLESVVINTLPVNNDQFQRGTANVNIYVPDQAQMLENAQVGMPDAARLDELTQMALPVLEELYTSEYRFELVNISGPIEVPETKQHYVNLRIDFLFFPS